MQDPSPGRPEAIDTARLLTYTAELELEVDRLRQQGRFIEKKAVEALTRILRLCTGPQAGDALPTLAEVEATARTLVEVVRDLHDPPGFHPAHDQVTAIAVRPLVEQTLRWQQRLTGSPGVTLRSDLGVEHIEWFPARLRHIFDNLFAHVLRSRDPSEAEPWVGVSLRAARGGYELRVTGKGIAPPTGEGRQLLELFYRAAPAREAGLGVGLAVVRLLVEQSGGTLAAAPGPGGEETFVLSLPRYDLLDYLE